MKKEKRFFLTIIGILFSATIFAQGGIGFYTNNGNKKVTQIKCGKFDNIKAKMKVPSYVKKFDLVKFKLWFGKSGSPGVIRYDGKGSVTQLASTPNLEKWVLKPGKQAGDFYVTSTAVNSYDLCGHPREKGLPSIKVIAEMVGYNKTGTKKYWDDFHKEYRYKTLYTSGTVIAKGKLTIIEQAAQKGYVSKNGVVSIEKVSGNLADEQIIGSNNESPTESFMSRLNASEGNDMLRAVQTKNSGKGFVSFNIVFFDDKKVEERVNELFHQIPSDLDHYQELKRDLLQVFAHGTSPGRFAEPFFDWPEVISKSFTPFLNPKAKLKPTRNYFANLEYWGKKKIGDYEYDYLKIPKCYGSGAVYDFDKSSLKFRKPHTEATAEIYAIRRGNVNVFIFVTYDENNYNNVFAPSSNPQLAKNQKEFIDKTFASLKFLK